jgi:hypothetical protein
MKKKLSLVLFCLLVGVLFLNLPAGTANSVFDQQAGDIFVYLPLMMKNYKSSGNGGLTGRVLDASSDTVIDGAKVCIQSACATADTKGNYTLTNIPVGTYQVNVSDPKARYYAATFTFTVIADNNFTRNFRLVKKLAAGNIEMRIILNWGDAAYWPGSDCTNDGYKNGCPADLDAHLWSVFTGFSVHLYQDPPDPQTGYPGHLGDCLNLGVCLERYDSLGPGPETVAVRELVGGESVYYYAVHNFYHGRTGVPVSPRDINATVTIYHLDGTTQEFNSRNAPQYYDGEIWYVFSMDSQGVITEQNCIIDADPSDNIPECP